MSSVEAIGVFTDISIPTLRGDLIVAGDITGSSDGELIRFFDDVACPLREAIKYSQFHIARCGSDECLVSRRGCLLKLGTDELGKSCDVGKSIGGRSSRCGGWTASISPASRSVSV